MIEYQFRPLAKWPRQQTPWNKRKRSNFAPTLDKVYRMLRSELDHLKAENPVVIEIAVKETDIRMDGLPRAGMNVPSFPGVLLSFRAKELGPMQYACDALTEWQANLRAIILTLERLRQIDVYGVTNRKEQYVGWKALPGPLVTPPAMSVEDAAVFIANEGGGVPYRDVMSSADTYRATYRRAAAKLHPDATGGTKNETVGTIAGGAIGPRNLPAPLTPPRQQQKGRALTYLAHHKDLPR